MLFNSLQFLIFFPVVTTLYFLFPHRYRWLLLLVASGVFYGAFIPSYLFIFVVIILVDYGAGILIECSASRRRKLFLLLSIISNLSLLGFFKYYNFFAENLTGLMQFLHWNYSLVTLSIILPIGLSFHTFQAMSYTIEVYRGRQKAERHLGIYALYVMFFPQLVAGPIERPQNLLHQFYEKHFFEYQRVVSGLKLMLWGLFKKIVIADRAALVVDTIYGHSGDFTGLPLVIASMLFTFQIYYDFSGYTDIARGSAQVLGFTLIRNFNVPFTSTSMTEMWQRWHISLSTWLRDYLYYPIALTWGRSSKIKLHLCLLITFVLIGLWHGANWTFVVFGLLHGLYLIIGSVTYGRRQQIAELTGLAKMPRVRKTLQQLSVFMLMSISLVFFRAPSLTDAVTIIQNMGKNIGAQLLDFEFIRYHLFTKSVAGLDKSGFVVLGFSLALMYCCYYFNKRGNILYAIKEKYVMARWAFYYFLFGYILFFGVFVANSFIYFQF